MIEFSYVWLFALLPLPFLLKKLLPEYKEDKQSLKVPFFEEYASLIGYRDRQNIKTKTSLKHTLIISLTWLGIVTALARPQYIEKPINKTIASRDLLLAIDLSGSMETEDFKDENNRKINRLQATKIVLDDFLTKRQGDRVGMIFFGSAAFIQVPFTEDLQTCRQLLDEAQVRMTGPKTMLGDAIGLAITVFQRSELKEKILIILTDGNDSGSKMDPDKAASIAADNGITIFTIAVGDPAAAGEEALDIEALRQIAKITGGSFYRAEDRQELQKIYEKIDNFKTRELETISHRPRKELYFWPLLLSIFIILTYQIHKQSCFALALRKHNRNNREEAS